MAVAEKVAPKASEGDAIEERGTDLTEMLAALEGRAEFYETLSYLYFKPLTQEQVDNMARADFSAFAGIGDGFASGIRDVTVYLRKRNTGTRQELAVDFTSAFAGTKTYEGRSAVPYESVFTSEEGLLFQKGYQEVFSTFKKSSLKLRDGIDYPDDHLSFMCEYMAIMSRRAATALETPGGCERARADMDASLAFLTDHILSWFDDFSAVANLILKTRFYQGVLRMSKAFFEFDQELLADLQAEMND